MVELVPWTSLPAGDERGRGAAVQVERRIKPELREDAGELVQEQAVILVRPSVDGNATSSVRSRTRIDSSGQYATCIVDARASPPSITRTR